MVRLPPVHCIPVGKVSVGSVWWTEGGHLHLTICAKATLGMVPAAEMEVLDPEPLRSEEERELPSLNVIAPVDLIPRVPRPEVTLSGHAMGEGASRVGVRLAVTRDGATVFDKRLEVLGDRGADGEPAPFARIALSYDRAVGGIGFADNPLGRGKGGSVKPAPNVVHPADPEGRVASFAPVPAAFASRKRLLGKLSPRRLAARPADVPDAFDWRYYQAAPEDQQLETLSGDEWIWLEGIVPGRPRFWSTLPRLRGAARVNGADVPLRAESLHVNADTSRCTLVWRASLRCTGTEPTFTVAAAVTRDGAAPEWPEIDFAESETPTVVPPMVPASLPNERTVVITAESEAPRADRYTETVEARPVATPTTPFGKPVPRSAPRPTSGIPGAPWSDTPLPDVNKSLGKFTVALDPPDPTANQAAEQLRAALAADQAKAEALAAAQIEEERGAAAKLAQERREAEAARFAREQQTAREADARREREAAAAKTEAAAKLRTNIYGGFKPGK